VNPAAAVSRCCFFPILDSPLLALSQRDRFTLRHACDGVHIFGGIGSGKTSGSGKALAGTYLRAGMGRLVLCAKPGATATLSGAGTVS